MAQIDKKQRIIVLFEAYLAFKKETTMTDFYKWMVENKITGYKVYTLREIGMIVYSSGKFEKKGSRWRMK